MAIRKVFFLILLCVTTLKTYAQFNINRLITSGEIALHYEDYVPAIQYFNRVIALKPHLYVPWYDRAIAKYYLDDNVGAESDITEAIKLNPYIDGMYDLRAITRIRQAKYKEAIADYNKAISIDNRNKNYWMNRAICLVNDKQYDEALLQTDSIAKRWPKIATTYSLKAEIYLNKKDTLKAEQWLDKSIELDAFDASSWLTKAYISLSRRQWKDADKALSKSIHLKPQNATLYVNRALARININNLRGAMDDYDKAIELQPDNFLAHYNRGLLRMQLGDDNRAILDFDYVIKIEPNNILAIFNRAVLLDKTGDLRKAIKDYTTVINQFPNFWTGLAYRARCYRRLGMTNLAELDEFKIFKAQMNKHLGIQQRWSSAKLKATRKRNEIDLDKYNQLVVEDENTVEREYDSEYRGKVQNKKTDLAFMPMFEISYLPYNNGVKAFTPFVIELEQLNTPHQNDQRMQLTCNAMPLTEKSSKTYFALVDNLSLQIDSTRDERSLLPKLFQRAIANSVLQNPEAAINDLTTIVQADSLNWLAYWQLAICQTNLNGFNATKGVDTRLQAAKALSFFDKAVAIHPKNAFLLYDRANLYVVLKENKKAIEDYTKAIKLEPSLAEAYYNRGLLYLQEGNIQEATTSLSKAGELGLYKAYSVLKHSKEKKK